MKILNLNGVWQMFKNGSTEPLSAEIPGSVAKTLLTHNKIPDPYVQDNEKKVLPVFDEDYIFTRRFDITDEMLTHRQLLLCCEGLDTLCEITVNNCFVAVCDNMHRTWRFDVKQLLKSGENIISIKFRSAAAYVKANTSRVGKPFSVIRKAACMFGWDWGLNLPDMGIWRDIYVKAVDKAEISHVKTVQKHVNGKVELEINAAASLSSGTVLRIAVADSRGKLLFSEVLNESGSCKAIIEEPELWWPAGCGVQPLYTITVTAEQNGTVYDSKMQKIGLRTIMLDRSADCDGSKYSFIVNGTPVFFRGENLIITDAVLSRFTDNDWRTLIKNCILSNLNGIRVWGGAVYPPDIFFELCDENGLMVYQDFMFACSFYEISQSFMENVRLEAEDNSKRIAHHASLALLCGNNEIDCIYTVSGSTEPETVALRRLFGSKDALPQPVRDMLWQMYEPLFCKLLPSVCAAYAPNTAYVTSSPCTSVPGGAQSFFEYLSDGDAHYYLQYNENAPYQRMREFHCRFMTEMGFQSYPSMKTVNAFADKESLSPYSDIMYAHQKCKNGNEAIELYMSRDYFVPDNFEDYVYLSQLQAGEILRYSVEHFRRDSAYCRGVILWQLNDCWPVVSWSGIDSFGRWKAQQYYIKRFYAPVLLSVCEQGAEASLYITNDTMREFNGKIIWQLCNTEGNVVTCGEINANVPSGKAILAETLSLELTREELNTHVLMYSLVQNGIKLSCASTLLCLAKDFNWQKPQVELGVEESNDSYIILVKASCFVKGICLDVENADCIFSDNFFDAAQGTEKTVTVLKADAHGIKDADDLRFKLTVKTLNDVMLKAKEQVI